MVRRRCLAQFRRGVAAVMVTSTTCVHRTYELDNSRLSTHFHGVARGLSVVE